MFGLPVLSKPGDIDEYKIDGYKRVSYQKAVFGKARNRDTTQRRYGL